MFSACGFNQDGAYSKPSALKARSLHGDEHRNQLLACNLSVVSEVINSSAEWITVNSLGPLTTSTYTCIYVDR